MDSRRWWLLAAAVPVALGVRAGHRAACADAWPGSSPSSVAGLLAAVGPLGRGAPRTTRPRGWRLLAVAPLLPVVGRPGSRSSTRSDPLQPSRCCAGRPPCPATCVVDRRHPRPGAPGAAARRAPDRRRGRPVLQPPASSWSGCSGRPGRQLVGARPGRAAGPGRGRRRHLGRHGRRADPAGRHRGRAAGRWPLVLLAGTVLLTARPGPGHVRPARRARRPCRGRQPAFLDRRRPPAPRRSPSCSTPGPRAGRPDGPAQRPRRPCVGQLLPHLALLAAVADGRRRRARPAAGPSPARSPGWSSASSSPPCTAG